MTRPDPRSILLVHPLGRRQGDAGRDISRLANVMPPLGLAGIAAYLQMRGFRVHIIDCHARPDSDQAILDYLRQERPAWMGFSCTTATFLDGARLSGLAKQTLPSVRSVFGGVHVSSQRERCLEQFPELDFAVVGEGEAALAELMESGGVPDAVRNLPGIVYRDASGQVQFTGRRTRLLDLDSLPFPAYEKLEGFPRRYTLPIFNYPRAPGATCTSSRGCPYACSYCDRSVFQRGYRFNSPEYLYEHMKLLHTRFGVRHVNFYDDQFTFHRPRVVRFCELLLARPLRMTFNCAVRANHVDQELLKLLKRAGCWMVSLGIESGDQALLQRHGRALDVEATADTVRMIRRSGLRAKGLLMLGLPGETLESIRKTRDYALSLRLDDVNLAKFTPFPGAPLYADIREHGGFQEDWERMDCMHFLFVPHGLDQETMEREFVEFYKRHYTSPRAMWDKVRMLWRSPDSWRRFLLHLGDFLRFARSGERYAS